MWRDVRRGYHHHHLSGDRCSSLAWSSSFSSQSLASPFSTWQLKNQVVLNINHIISLLCLKPKLLIRPTRPTWSGPLLLPQAYFLHVFPSCSIPQPHWPPFHPLNTSHLFPHQHFADATPFSWNAFLLDLHKSGSSSLFKFQLKHRLFKAAFPGPSR